MVRTRSRTVNPRRKHFLTVDDVISQYWESHIRKLSQGSQGAFARFVAEAVCGNYPQLPPGEGYNKRKRFSDFGTMFGNRAFAAIKPPTSNSSRTSCVLSLQS